MVKIKVACLRFLDSRSKDYYKSIEYIYFKKTDKEHICPQSYEDFDYQHEYYVYWSSCGSNCSVKDRCCSFYKAYILSLGESEKDAAQQNNQRKKRIIYKKQNTSTTSSDGSTLNNTPVKNVIDQQKIAKKINSDNIISKYNTKQLLSSRKTLVLDNVPDKSEEDVSTSNKNQSTMHNNLLNIDKDAVVRLSRVNHQSTVTKQHSRCDEGSTSLPQNHSRSRSRSQSYQNYSPYRSGYRSQHGSSRRSRSQSKNNFLPSIENSSRSSQSNDQSRPAQDILPPPTQKSFQSCSELTPRYRSRSRSRSCISKSRCFTGKPKTRSASKSSLASLRRSRNRYTSRRSLISPGKSRNRSASRLRHASSGRSRNRSASRSSFVSSRRSRNRYTSRRRLISPGRSRNRSASRRSFASVGRSGNRSASRRSFASVGRSRNRSASRLSFAPSRRSRNRSASKSSFVSARRSRNRSVSRLRHASSGRSRNRPSSVQSSIRGRSRPSQAEVSSRTRIRSRTNSIDSDDSDTRDPYFPLIQEYKIRLYRQYRRLGLLVAPERERHDMYEIRDEKIYLGMGITVGERTWKLMQLKGRKKFLRETAYLIWKKKLAYCCLDTIRLKNRTVGDIPVKLCCPIKLEHYLKLYVDFLDTHENNSQLTDDDKDILIKDATEQLTVYIRDERKKILEKLRKQATRQRE